MFCLNVRSQEPTFRLHLPKSDPLPADTCLVSLSAGPTFIRSHLPNIDPPRYLSFALCPDPATASALHPAALGVTKVFSIAGALLGALLCAFQDIGMHQACSTAVLSSFLLLGALHESAELLVEPGRANSIDYFGVGGGRRLGGAR